MNSPVLKNILAAVVGYVVMFATLFIAFSIMWLILGPEGSFQAGTWDVSGAWLGTSLVLAVVAGKAGGFVCTKIGANRHAVLILIGVMVVMAILSAIPDAPAAVGPRPADVSMTEAMTTAAQPSWIFWANPVLGILGVALGARLASR